MAENEEPGFSAQLNALISNAELDRLIADRGTNALAKGSRVFRLIGRRIRVPRSCNSPAFTFLIAQNGHFSACLSASRRREVPP